MNVQTMYVLAQKDFTLFFKNKFFAVITTMALVFYILFYYLVPSSVDEVIDIGLYAPELAPVVEMVTEKTEKEGLRFHIVESREELERQVLDGDIAAGMVVPKGAVRIGFTGVRLLPGKTVGLVISSDVPKDVQELIETVFRDALAAMFGGRSTVSFDKTVLGPDLAGAQIPPRNRMRPLLAFLIIMFESLGLANLITEEIERRTMKAVMMAPVTVWELFISKAVMGVSLALTESIFVMLIMGGFNHQPLIILLVLFFGSVLVTGLAFIVGSLGKDFMSVMAWGMLFFMILIIPAFGVMFPEFSTSWIRYIPTFYIVDVLHRVSNFQAGWLDVGKQLIILAGISVLFTGGGLLTLSRRAR